MSELQAKKEIGIVAIRGTVRRTALSYHAGKVRLCRFRQCDLPGIRATILGDCAGLSPEHLRSTGSESHISPEREFAGSPVEFTVAAFHGMNAPAVPDRATSDCHRLKNRCQIICEAQGDSEPCVLDLEFRD